MEHFVILSEKPWHAPLFESCLKDFQSYEWTWIKTKEEFTTKFLQSINPHKIFIPHWSYKIPSEIFGTYDCVIFHMTDLPFGRGGSPLQNLIIRGHKKTKMSAITAVEEFDAGDIYLKKELDLSGTAREIFERCNEVMRGMISEIILHDIEPYPQEGTPTVFKRRKPHMSSIREIEDLDKIYDHIRMLDADGYPHAYIETDSVKLEFTNAKWVANNLEANVRIVKK